MKVSRAFLSAWDSGCLKICKMNGRKLEGPDKVVAPAESNRSATDTDMSPDADKPDIFRSVSPEEFEKLKVPGVEAFRECLRKAAQDTGYTRRHFRWRSGFGLFYR